MANREKPRQMWELDPEVEKNMADRSIWLRGLGVGRNVEEIKPLLERTGCIVERVRVYRLRDSDQWGKHAVYATYGNREKADLNLVRLAHSTLNGHRLHTRKASADGAYRPLTDRMRERIASMKMTKEEKMIIIQKRKSAEKLNKIRQLNQNLRVASSSPHCESVKPAKEDKSAEISSSKEDNRLKRKSSDETSAYRQRNVDKKRIRREDGRIEPKRREERPREEGKERRGPRTPPTPDNIDPIDEPERNPFLNDEEDDWPSSSVQWTPNKRRRGGKRRRGAFR